MRSGWWVGLALCACGDVQERLDTDEVDAVVEVEIVAPIDVVETLEDIAEVDAGDTAAQVDTPEEVVEVEVVAPLKRCAQPREGDPFEPCRAGATTFLVEVGMQRDRSFALGLDSDLACGVDVRAEEGCVYRALEVACPPADALPEVGAGQYLQQGHPYMVVLRNWLATLTEADFTLNVEDQDPVAPGLQTMAVDEDYFSGPDALERLFNFYLVTDKRGGDMPSTRGLQLDAAGFTLAGFERNDAELGPHVRLQVGRNAMLEPSHTTWWALWDYPKNPIHQGANRRAALLRGFVAAMVDLVMRDGYLGIGDVDGDGIDNTDQYVGGWSSQAIMNPLAFYAYTYAAMEDLDPCVRAAYETGLRRYLRRVAAQGMAAAAGNNDIPQHVHFGLYYLSKVLADPAITERAIAISKSVLSPPYRSPTGYVTHSAANEISWSYDPAYNGIALHHLAGAVMASRGDPAWAFLADLVREEQVLKAHQTMLEPDGVQVSPSHYANASSAGTTHDQWFQKNRDYGLALASPESGHLVYRPRTRGGYGEYRVGMPNEADLRYEAQVAAFWIGAADTDPGSFRWPLLATPIAWPDREWGAVSWSEGLTGTYFAPPDARAQLAALADTDWAKTPFERDPFVRAIGDEFVFAKVGELGVILHTGQVTRQWSTSPDEVVSGLGGGQISALWTASAGAAWLGWVHGTQDSTWGQELWTDWRGWPAHVLSGVTDSGVFSSGRIAIPVVTRESRADGLFVTVGGAIGRGGEDFSAQTGALVSPLDYQRTFLVGEGGVDVTTTLTGDAQDVVNELSETLPFFIGLAWEQDFARVAPRLIVTHSDGATESFDLQALREASDAPMHDVIALAYERFDGALEVTFDVPRRVRLGAFLASTEYQWSPVSRVVRVELVSEPTPFVAAAVSYHIRQRARD